MHSSLTCGLVNICFMFFVLQSGEAKVNPITTSTQLSRTTQLTAALSTSAAAISKTATAHFNADTVKGYIKFISKGGDSVALEVDLKGLGKQAGQFHIHTFPVAKTDINHPKKLSSTDCTNRDVAGHFSYKDVNDQGVYAGELQLDYGMVLENKDSVQSGFPQKPPRKFINGITGGIKLSGPNSIIGRSIVIHKTDGSRWVCATILEDDVEYNVVRAKFGSSQKISGTVEFLQDKANDDADTIVFINLICGSTGDCITDHNWMLYPTCTSTKRIPGFPSFPCERLPCRHFVIMSSKDLSLSEALATASLSITESDSPEIMACAPLSHIVKTATAHFNADGVKGTISFVPNWQGNITLHVDMKGLNSKAGQFHIHSFAPATTDVNDPTTFSGTQCSGGSVGGHFSYKVAGQTARAAGELHLDYGMILANKNEVRGTFPPNPPSPYGKDKITGGVRMSGPNSIMGRSIVIHTKDGPKWVCAAIFEDNVEYKVVQAKFVGQMSGTVQLMQDRANPDGETTVFVRLEEKTAVSGNFIWQLSPSCVLDEKASTNFPDYPKFPCTQFPCDKVLTISGGQLPLSQHLTETSLSITGADGDGRLACASFSQCELGCGTLAPSDDHGGQLSVFQLSMIIGAAVVVVGVAVVLFIVFKRPSVCKRKQEKETAAVTPQSLVNKQEQTPNADPTVPTSKRKPLSRTLSKVFVDQRAAEFKLSTHMSSKDFQNYWRDVARNGALTLRQVTEKVERIRRCSLERQTAQKKRGEEHYRIHLESVGVDGLSALSDKWRDAMVPKHSLEGQRCLKALEKYDDSINKGDEFCHSDTRAFHNTMEQVVKPFWNSVIRMYKEDLLNRKAREQVVSLLHNLAKYYESTYDVTFRIVQDGDRDGFEAFKREMERQMQLVPVINLAQTQTNILSLYDDAVAVRPAYMQLCKVIAERTNGDFKIAPIKNMFRSIEKTAMRADEKNRFLCSNVYDVVRGALVYDTMEGVLSGLTEVCKTFTVLRIKNRFVPVGEALSSGGWRDIVVNMHVKDDARKHILEVQIQLDCLLNVRKKLGGHFIYAKYRALMEALEVCGYMDEVNDVLNHS